MNMAVGFPCPTCGHQVANLLEIEKDERAQPIAFRLHCMRCEAVYRELREGADQGAVSSGVLPLW